MQLQPHKHKYIITAYNCGARQQIALYMRETGTEFATDLLLRPNRNWGGMYSLKTHWESTGKAQDKQCKMACLE